MLKEYFDMQAQWVLLLQRVNGFDGCRFSSSWVHLRMHARTHTHTEVAIHPFYIIWIGQLKRKRKYARACAHKSAEWMLKTEKRNNIPLLLNWAKIKKKHILISKRMECNGISKMDSNVLDREETGSNFYALFLYII